MPHSSSGLNRPQAITKLALLALLMLTPIATLHAQTVDVPGLSAPVTIYEDAQGIPTIVGSSDADIAFMQGWIEARDRFFQMDFQRRQAQGTLASLVGQPALSTDIQIRNLGLGRAALDSLRTASPEMKSLAQAYSNGVNFWLANNPLPIEYQGLELTSVPSWTARDTFAIAQLLAFGLGFGLGDIDNTIALGTYQAVGDIVGFDGTVLYFEDTNRQQSPDDRFTVPGFLDSIGGIGSIPAQSEGTEATGSTKPAAQAAIQVPRISSELLEMAKSVQGLAEQLPRLSPSREIPAGSNWWAIAGEHTESGFPMLQSDPHLSLGTPATWYRVNTVVTDGSDSWSVSGVSFPGTPLITLGCSQYACWGATVAEIDEVDVFQEQFLLNAFGLPTHSLYQGQPEPIRAIFNSYFVNQVGDGTADNTVRANVGYDEGGITFLIPRRNNGPIVNIDGNTGLSVQYTGFSANTDLEAFLGFNKATSLEEFQAAVGLFDVGSQNFLYADIDGNIAYFEGNENPIRSDLQQGTVDGGIPPFIIRDGTGSLNHEWMPVANPQPNQSLPYEIMPADELPHAINPASGYLANGNNDPIGLLDDNNALNQVRPGGGIYYLNDGYSDFRMGRIDRVIQELIASGDKITEQDMIDLQANNQLLDAELMMGYIRPVLEAYQALPDAGPFDPLELPVQLLLDWDYSTPTGIPEGYDPGDDWTNLPQPSQEEINHSVAATIFSLFRGRMIANTIDATLGAIGLGGNLPGGSQAYGALLHHLEQFPTAGGVGASGIPFISVPGVDDPQQALFQVVIGSLQQALELAASDEFAPAFGNSDDPMDYRWGKLHRIVFDHPLNMPPLNVPNGFMFSDLAPDLPGVARHGGFGAVDASSHNARANGLNEFMFGSGASQRLRAVMDPAGIQANNTIPGGQSGDPFSPDYSSQLGRWLTNDYFPMTLGADDAAANAARETTFAPPSP